MAAANGDVSRADLAARWGLCIAVGLGVWLAPVPSGVTAAGWAVCAVFAATIVSFLVRPLPMAPMVLIALTITAATGALPFERTLAGYGSRTVWLVVAAFLIAGAVGHTGLGRRIALLLVHKLGRTPLGLGYAFCAAELVLAPVTPSNTARGGGIMAPIVRSVAEALGSRPGAQARRAGEYLVLTAAQANLITAALFLTAMAANALVYEAAGDILDVEFGWGTWALGACVPGLVSLALLPLVIHRLAPPELRDTRAAQAGARDELAAMGPWSRAEKVMAVVFVLLLVLWATSQLHGLSAHVVAWVGVCVLFLTGVQRWAQASRNAGAWDALVWLGGLLSLTKALKAEGVVDWFSSAVGEHLAGLGGTWAALALAVVYFYSMYGFSMFTIHITALVGAFFGVALGLGAPPLLAVALLAYFSTLCGCLTHYSTAPVVIYFAFGYVSVPRWFRVGLLLSFVHLGVWLTLGLAWWKLLGWW